MADKDMSLEALRERKAARDAAVKQESEKREVEVLTLEETLTERLGRRGIAFEIVETEVGVFGLRRPDYVQAKNFNAKSPVTDEDVASFVKPCVEYPSKEKFTSVLLEHGGVAWRCAKALLAMYAGEAQAHSGKF